LAWVRGSKPKDRRKIKKKKNENRQDSYVDVGFWPDIGKNCAYYRKEESEIKNGNRFAYETEDSVECQSCGVAKLKCTSRKF